MNRFFLIAAALFFASVASAVVVESEVRAEASASPEAMPDPMSMALVLVPAEGSTGPRKELGATSTICPSDFTNGYSIMCTSSYSRASFWIDGKFLRTEVKSPFYAAGNVGGRVNSFSPPMGKMMFTLACKADGEVVRSKISIMC